MFETVFAAAISWIAIAVIFAIIEAFTMGLTTIWFAGGGLGACIASMIGAPIVVQVVVFVAVSLILLVIARPIARKHLNSKIIDTNINALIGQEDVAETDLSAHELGRVKADGKVWSAICDRGEISKGSLVTIKSIRGVTLTVIGQPKPEERKDTKDTNV